jgi:hypothetical protein
LPKKVLVHVIIVKKYYSDGFGEHWLSSSNDMLSRTTILYSLCPQIRGCRRFVIGLFFLLLHLLDSNILLGMAAVGHSKANDFISGCSFLQQQLWQKHRDSCAYNLWFSTADESLVIADQLARPVVKLQGYGFHEDIAWSVGCAWCSSASAPVVASGGWDGALMWWNASTGAFLFKQSFPHGIITALSGHQAAVPPPAVMLMATWKGSVLAVSPCDHNDPFASSNGIGFKPVLLWDVVVSSTPLHSVCLCGDMGFVGSNDGTATSVTLLDGKIVNRIRVSSEALWSMACFAGREHRLVAASGKQKLFCSCIHAACIILLFVCRRRIGLHSFCFPCNWIGSAA